MWLLYSLAAIYLAVTAFVFVRLVWEWRRVLDFGFVFVILVVALMWPSRLAQPKG